MNRITVNGTLQKKIIASDYDNDALLGVNPTSMSVDGNTIAAGAPGFSNWNGAVYIFEKNNNDWVETQKITSPESADYGNFGIGVSLFVGYLEKTARTIGNLTRNWKPQNDITEDFYGWSIAMGDNEIIVGASSDNLDNNEENELNDAGSVYIFTSTTLATNENNLCENDVKIYPNPAKDFINIKSQKDINSIEIIEQSGKRITKTKDFKIHISQLTKGVYILKIKFSNGSSSI